MKKTVLILKKMASILWKAVLSIFALIFWIIKFVLKVLWWVVKISVAILFPIERKPDAWANMELMFDKEPAAPGEENTAQAVGSVVPVEEDHNLRVFTIHNPEGEIYRINTATPGPFYGARWTHILSTYETQQTLRGRLVKPVYGKSGYPSGYQVKFGQIKAFLPNYHSMRKNTERSINIRVAVLSLDPVTMNVIVSARLAYEILFAEKPYPETGAEAQALYWDYDDKRVYLLLPGEYLASAPMNHTPIEIASLMGTLTRCHVESLDQEKHEAEVLLPGSPVPLGVGVNHVEMISSDNGDTPEKSKGTGDEVAHNIQN